MNHLLASTPPAHSPRPSGVRRRLLIPAALAALVSLTAAGTANGATDASGSLTTRAGLVQQWSAAHMADDKSVSEAQAIEIARRFDVITVSKNEFRNYAAKMYAANPRLQMLVYINAALVPKSEANKWPADWYAKSRTGGKIQSRKFGNYLMDVGNAGWQDHVVAVCRAQRTYANATGCYADMLGVAPLSTSYVNSEPINPRANQPWSKDDYLKATSTIATKVRAAGNTLVGNGIGGGGQYFRSPGSTKQLLAALDGGHVEAWLRNAPDSITKYANESTWKLDIDELAAAGAVGHPLLVQVKTWTNSTQAQRDSWHKYALASFLLGTDGKSYFTFSEDRTLAKATADNAWDRANVGSPSGSYSKQGSGAYVRSFSSGFAAVNPTDHSVSVSLPAGAYRTLSGGTAAGSVTLASHTGEVFVK